MIHSFARLFVSRGRLVAWLVAVGITVAASIDCALARADDADWTRQTYVYKTVGPTKIEADVSRKNGTQARPAVVWIHGGALIMGNRKGVPRDIVGLCKANNYVLISIDYRLAPEVQLPAIIDDLKDAFRWIYTQGPAQFHLDPEKIVVCGGSAGGYLTMMSGFCIEPRPKALVAYWGYGDVDGDWYTKPAYRNAPRVSKEDAYKAVGGEVQTGSEGGDRGKYYMYLRQNGLWSREVTGFDAKTERQKLDPYCPVRNITPQYPPILMVHGTADEDVPYQESVDMANELKRQGLPHELITVEGGGHGLGGGDKKVIADAHARALEFIRKQLD
jgi:acetyl esterase/lipase